MPSREPEPSGYGTGPAVVCLGESMAQIVPLDRPSLREATTFGISNAGAESNVAVNLARLGTSVGWAGRIGDDPLGHRIVDELALAGVDTRYVRIDTARRTGVFFKDPRPGGSKVHYYRDGSAASAMGAEDLAAVLAGSPAWLHLSGVTPALSGSCAEMVLQALATSRSMGVRTSLDVNFRPVLWPSTAVAGAALAEAANRADVVFVGLDEALALWSTPRPTDVRKLLDRPEVLIVKDGGAPATSFHGEQAFSQPALPVAVIEPVGAGDAFAAGWIHAALRGFDPAACLRLAHLMASVALGSVSDYGDLPCPPVVLEQRARSGADWLALEV